MHWIVQRKRAGLLTMLNSFHTDNPELYDDDGNITEAGKQRIGVLDRLTGTTKLRLRYGIWAQPEGAIYSVFDENKHKVKAFPIPHQWVRVVGIDPTGAYIAAVWVAFDSTNTKLVVHREYYEPFGLPTSHHCKNILALSGYDAMGYSQSTQSEPILAFVGGGPSERQQRLDFTSNHVPMQEPGIVDVWSGIDAIIDLLNDDSLVIMDNCVNLLSEIGSYRRKMVDGRVSDQIESKTDFHLCDSLRYAIAYLVTKNIRREVVSTGYKIGNY
jgi:hypothetical protein